MYMNIYIYIYIHIYTYTYVYIYNVYLKIRNLGTCKVSQPPWSFQVAPPVGWMHQAAGPWASGDGETQLEESKNGSRPPSQAVDSSWGQRPRYLRRSVCV